MPFDPVGYVETKIVDADGEVLRRAADYIEQHGWCQNTMSTPSGRVCLVGALLAAAPDAGSAQVTRILDRLGPGIVSWNDYVGRTKEEVTARLRSAAEQGAS